MAEYEITTCFSNAGTRNEVRMRVVNKFAEEAPGKGKGDDASRYKYFVETIDDGRSVYLRRPANLHNGFDFVVHVEDTNFNIDGRKRTNPTHDDIIQDLENKYNEDELKYQQLYELMEGVYLCEDIDEYSYESIDFSDGYSVDMILKVLKWLFIEQDIRYWNYSGRGMLWERINSINHN